MGHIRSITRPQIGSLLRYRNHMAKLYIGEEFHGLRMGYFKSNAVFRLSMKTGSERVVLEAPAVVPVVEGSQRRAKASQVRSLGPPGVVQRVPKLPHVIAGNKPQFGVETWSSIQVAGLVLKVSAGCTSKM